MLKHLLLILSCLTSMTALAGDELNVIRYTTTDGRAMEPHDLSKIDGHLVSNEYHDGFGEMRFEPLHGQSITSLGDSSFLDCNRLTSIIIPEGVTTIGYRAFAPCSTLYSIILPSTLDSIADRAFHGAKVTSIELPYGIPRLPFFGLGFSLLSHISIPASVTEIGISAFECCYYLESVDIPVSVNHIFSYAFANCTSLTTINYEGTIKQWNSIKKETHWDIGGFQSTPIEVIHCADGDIEMTPWIVESNHPRPTSYQLDVSSAEWATLSIPITVTDIPEGLTIYNATGVVPETGEIQLRQTNKILADKAYLVHGTPGTYQLDGLLFNTTEYSAEKLKDGALTGTYDDVVLSSTPDAYVLQAPDGNARFYRVDPSTPVTLTANRAFLTFSSSPEKAPSRLSIGEDQALHISMPSRSTAPAANSIHDVTGRKLASPCQGLNVVRSDDGTVQKAYFR